MSFDDDEAQPLVYGHPELTHPQGRRFWLDDSMFPLDKDGLPEPRFSTQETTRCFFGYGPDWLRWRARPDGTRAPHGYFILDGEPLQFKRTSKNARYFTLSDIERMAHALAQRGIFDGQQLSNTVMAVKICARIYHIPNI